MIARRSLLNQQPPTKRKPPWKSFEAGFASKTAKNINVSKI
jgi:hypothetical protein